MNPLSTLKGQRHSTGIKTNGIRRPCTSHLNLTVSLADVWGVRPPPRIRMAGPRTDLPPPKPRLPLVKAKKPMLPPFAGYDPTERPW